jgi:hypothetical protein
MALPTETVTALNTALITLLNSAAAESGDDVPQMKQLTTVALDGTGVFDKLMAVCGLHAQREFDEDRIRGADYATVYLGMMQACLQASTSFLIQWDKAAVEKANLIATLTATLGQVDLLLAQKHLYLQKTITEMGETNTIIPAIAAGSDLSEVVPLVGLKVEGAKGANRDVTLEQRAGYMRKAQNDLIKIATGHVDMLVSSGAATDVGQYTSDLLELLQTGAATTNFPAEALLTIAVTDAATLDPGAADSV